MLHPEKKLILNLIPMRALVDILFYQADPWIIYPYNSRWILFLS